MKYNIGIVEYKLIPEFLNISFTKNKGSISIDRFVTNLYEAKRIDILVKIFRLLEPEAYYLGYHNFFNAQNVNPLVDFYTSYNIDKGLREEDISVISYHKNIDVQILKKHAPLLFKIQTELENILQGIIAAQQLNKSIASIYSDVSDLDAHIIWKHHNQLYMDAQEELFLEEVAYDINQVNLEEHYIDSLSLPHEDEREEQLRLKKLLNLIQKREKKHKIQNMINFDLIRYRNMLDLMKSPHFDHSNEEYLIAKFAGDMTPLLESRLKEVNLQFGLPVRNPYTGIWSYSIDFTTNFIGLIYRHFLDYVNLMMEGIGYIPTCAWCKKPINPTAQQLRWLRNGSDIYCITNMKEEDYNSCRRKGTTSKQNEKRRKQKMQQNYLESSIESIAERKIKNHFKLKRMLTTQEQGDIILLSINENLNQKFK